MLASQSAKASPQPDSTRQSPLVRETGGMDGEKEVIKVGSRPVARYNEAIAFSYKSYIRAVSCALVNMLPFQWRSRQSRCTLLGRHYDIASPTGYQEFIRDFTSRLLLTYRWGFPPLPSPATWPEPPNLTSGATAGSEVPTSSQATPSILSLKRRPFAVFRTRSAGPEAATGGCGLTSDDGWGCMIRVFQMAVGQIVMNLTLGRNWRRPGHRCVLNNDRPSKGGDEDAGNILEEYPAEAKQRSLRVSRSFLRGLRQKSQPSITVRPQRGELLKSFESTLMDPSIYPWNIIPALSLLRDDPAARFSLHRVVWLGHNVLGIKPGEWFGPTSCAQCITQLMNGYDMDPGSSLSDTSDLSQPLRINGCEIRAFHSEDGILPRYQLGPLLERFLPKERYIDHLIGAGRRRLGAVDSSPCSVDCPRDTCEGYSPPLRSVSLDEENRTVSQVLRPNPHALTLTGDSELVPRKAVALFISLRLGLINFNLRYQRMLQSCFRMEAFQGLAGGGPLTSAYWFVACTDEHLYYLDPHNPVQQAMLSISPEAEMEATEGVRNKGVKRIEVDDLAEEWNGNQGRAVACLRLNDRICTKGEADAMFFPRSPQQLPWHSLNPSMTLVFCVKSMVEFENLSMELREADTDNCLDIQDELPFSRPEVDSSKPYEDDGFFVL